MNGESLWPRLAGLPLVIEACEYDRLHAVLAYEFERFTTHVRLVGAGVDGLGPVGGGFHSEGEHLYLSSVTPRLYLLSKLIMDLGRNPPPRMK